MENKEAFTEISAEPEESVELIGEKTTTKEEEVVQTEVVTEVIIEAVTTSTAQLQEEEVTIHIEVTQDIMVKQRKQVLQATWK